LISHILFLIILKVFVPDINLLFTSSNNFIIIKYRIFFSAATVQWEWDAYAWTARVGFVGSADSFARLFGWFFG